MLVFRFCKLLSLIIINVDFMYCRTVQRGLTRLSLITVCENKSRLLSVFPTKMPKKDKPSKIAQKKQPETPPSPVSILKDGAITIAIHAKPGAKQNAITDVSADSVGVAIAAPPTDGEANAELVRYLSKVLELKKSEITLDKGSKSREKVIKVTAPISEVQVLERLEKESRGC